MEAEPLSGTITAITPSKTGPDRASIRVNGRALVSLPWKIIADLGLAVGQAWDAAVAQRVAEAKSYDQAFAAAAKRLERRALSSKQLSDKLRELEFDEPVRRRVLGRLEELGLIDDQALGRRIIEDMQSRKAAGPALLRKKLYQRGLERALIDRLLAELEANPARDAVADAAALAERRMGSLRGLEPMVQKRRLWGLLARRGFDPDTIKEAIGRVKGLGNDRNE